MQITHRTRSNWLIDLKHPPHQKKKDNSKTHKTVNEADTTPKLLKTYLTNISKKSSQPIVRKQSDPKGIIYQMD